VGLIFALTLVFMDAGAPARWLFSFSSLSVHTSDAVCKKTFSVMGFTAFGEFYTKIVTKKTSREGKRLIAVPIFFWAFGSCLGVGKQHVIVQSSAEEMPQGPLRLQ